jgi:WD40 repeat protein
VFCVKYLTFADVSMLIVGMSDGFQAWTPEGTRLLFFHPVRPANDEDICFVKGIDNIKGGRAEFLVGDSTGAVHTFLLGNAGRGFNVNLVKNRREHGEAISDITCSSKHVVTGDDAGSLCVYSVNQEATPGGHNLMTKIHELASSPFPITSLKVFGSCCVASFTSGHLRYIDLEDGKVKVEVAAHSRTITGISGSKLPDGTMVCATASEDSVVSVWSVPEAIGENGGDVKLLYKDKLTDKKLTGICFLTDTRQDTKIVASSFDCDHLDVWDEIS